MVLFLFKCSFCVCRVDDDHHKVANRPPELEYDPVRRAQIQRETVRENRDETKRSQRRINNNFERVCAVCLASSSLFAHPFTHLTIFVCCFFYLKQLSKFSNSNNRKRRIFSLWNIGDTNTFFSHLLLSLAVISASRHFVILGQLYRYLPFLLLVSRITCPESFVKLE